MCGVEARQIREAARIYARERPAMSFHGLGLTEHIQGTEGVMCLVNLALLTGNIGRPGAGINPLRGQNNVQGAAHMGCDPGILTGSVSLKEGRDLFSKSVAGDRSNKERPKPAGHVGCGRGGQIQGLVGDRLRHLLDECQCRLHETRPGTHGTGHYPGYVPK